MPIELECKVAVSSHRGLSEKLRAAGAAYLGRVVESNLLFDDAQKALLQRGCGLRVRGLRVLDGHAGGVSATMTFKGPVEKSAFKQREEIELPIADAITMARLLMSLGYAPWLTFEKRRESWRLALEGSSAVCAVELDELPELGCFVEIEGPTEAAIRQAAGLLGIDPGASISRSYAALIVERKGEGPLELKFSESTGGASVRVQS